MSANFIILTGDIQTGKTTWLQKWTGTKEKIVGILSPVINGKRNFYDIEQKIFLPMDAAVDEQEVLTIGKYLFSGKAFDTVSNQLLSCSAKTDWEYLVIDEIGPLELIHKKGLYEPLVTLIRNTQRNCTIIIVVRTQMLERMNDLIESFRKRSNIVLLRELEIGLANI